MVALEGAAAGAPLAVAATGGLARIVKPGVTGMTFPAQNPGALAHAIDILLSDAELARRMATRARTTVRDSYNWDSIARKTAAVYDAAIAQAPRFEATRVEALLAGGRQVVVRESNLLAATAA